MEKCKVDWCDSKPVRSGKGYCRLHYDQIRQYGHITNFRPKGKRNNIVVKDNHAELQILDKDGKIKKIALLDKDVVNKISKYSFRMHNNGYVVTAIKKKTLYLHQIILGTKKDNYEIDHINRNKLDNRKNNLRLCKHIDNTHNRKRNIDQGINFINRKLNKQYRATIIDNNKLYFLGYFKTKDEAIKVRREKEKELYKNFAST